jgi:hypothetical protein
MRSGTATGAIAVSALFGVFFARSALLTPALRAVDESVLREYTGVYQWDGGGFLYLQMWGEFTGKNDFGAFDESGELRALHPTDRDRFFAGPGAAVSNAVESRIDFRRDDDGRIVALTWQRDGHLARTGRRVEIERHEDLRFPSGQLRLAGTLITPNRGEKHPAVILVHGSGAATRDQILPHARFLVRRGMAILHYDKRGVGGSTGDWNDASFEDLAADVVAAFEYLKTRPDIDSKQIGLLGVSQAGWVMPIAAVRAPDLAFLISVSGAGVPGAETTIDHAQREMSASGMKPHTIEEIVTAMKLQYEFVRTGHGWEAYAAARNKLASRLGSPPGSFPATPDDPWFLFIRRLLFYDPAPTLRQLRVPTLALFGELDNNILPEKNNAAWDAALAASGNRDYTSVIVPRANHMMLEAQVGNNAEMASLRRFVPAYFTTVDQWLAKRIRGLARRPHDGSAGMFDVGLQGGAR